MKLDGMEWQLFDTARQIWILGFKVRGVARGCLAQIMVDPGIGWVWRVNLVETRLGRNGDKVKANSFDEAIRAAEEAVEAFNGTAFVCETTGAVTITASPRY